MKTLLYSLLLSIIFIVGCNSDKSTEPKSAYDDASISKGGIMFDKFWSVEAEFNQTDANIAKFSQYGDFFRCKQCHGWDLQGRNGAYINRGPKTSRPNISDHDLYTYAQTKTADQIFDAIKSSTSRRDIAYDLATYNPTTNSTVGDQMPNYSQLLTDAQIWDLVKFLKEGAIDVTKIYDATYTGTYPTGSFSFSNVGKDGNSTNGNSFYTSKCFVCHGTDGKLISLEAGKSVGNFTRTKAYEVQHKVKYGQLGSAMVGQFDITLSQMKDLYKALADTTAFPN
ncbi:MAG: cytochrome c [Bacteroidetes bacterium]|nr:cytochrome c [Bacteroidota bacterium]MBU1680649.1 cytochrome c [Bacteroidota bacterium]